MKSKTWIVVLGFVLLIKPLHCLADTIKYFKSYSINQWDCTIVPKDSLTEEQALKDRCLRFLYNDQNQLVEIEGFAYGLNFIDDVEDVYQIHFQYQDLF